MMTGKLFAIALALAIMLSPAWGEDRPLAPYVLRANNEAILCYRANAPKFDDGVSDVKIIARAVRHACEVKIEHALARRWHWALDGDPNDPKIDGNWWEAKGEYQQKHGDQLATYWYERSMTDIISAILSQRAAK